MDRKPLPPAVYTTVPPLGGSFALDIVSMKLKTNLQPSIILCRLVSVFHFLQLLGISEMIHWSPRGVIYGIIFP